MVAIVMAPLVFGQVPLESSLFVSLLHIIAVEYSLLEGTLGVDNSCTGHVTADPPPPAPPCPAPAPTLLTHVNFCVCSNRTLSPAEGRWQAECFC
jgi:hypothetical protein